MKKMCVLFVVIALTGCGNKEEKRDLFLLCEGSVIYDKDITPKPMAVSSSFYIGKDYVEQEGTKYQICDEKKTEIRFSDDCKNTQLTEGRIDLIMKTVNVDETLKKMTPNRQRYECKVEKNPRY